VENSSTASEVLPGLVLIDISRKATTLLQFHHSIEDEDL